MIQPVLNLQVYNESVVDMAAAVPRSVVDGQLEDRVREVHLTSFDCFNALKLVDPVHLSLPW